VTFLASVASAAPFIGLFGTVWGIMNAFHGLSQAKSTTIQAVAPGISEALVATAVGLAAAIPAAVAFNYFTASIKKFRQLMDSFSEEFLNIARRYFVK
jgi:biopolymer transport protein TolQ